MKKPVHHSDTLVIFLEPGNFPANRVAGLINIAAQESIFEECYAAMDFATLNRSVSVFPE